MTEKETNNTVMDISQLRSPIQISGKPMEQVLSSIHYGSPELRCLLMDECDLIFECKVCRALFRDLPNFISHKRIYCTKSSMENRHVTIANLPEEKVVVIQPQAPEETEHQLQSSTRQPARQQPKRTPKQNLEDTIKRIQSGELGHSLAYQVYTNAAEKLQRQKEGMKVATIRTTTIPTNKNAVFMDVNMTCVNIHERQPSATLYDQSRNDTSVTVVKRKNADRHDSIRNSRKSAKQEKQSSEPQKILMEHLKEIQQKRVKNAPQYKESFKGSSKTILNENQVQISANTTPPTVQKKVSATAVQKVLAYDKVQTQTELDNNKTKLNLKDSEAVAKSLSKHEEKGISGKLISKEYHKNSLRTINTALAVRTRKRLTEQSLICSKCSAVFATRKSLSFHIKIHHATKRTFYPCPYCQSTFYYFYGITRHLLQNHDKTLEEVDAMRSQLREKSFTKPHSTSSEKRGIVPASTRSTRTLARNIQVNMLQNLSSKDSMSVANEKHLPKRNSGSHESSEATSITTDKKISQLAALLDSHHCNHPSISSENKTEKKGPARLGRPRKQQPSSTYILHKTDKLTDIVDSSLKTVTMLPSQKSSSTEVNKREKTSHKCPKCRRSFRRKISLKNHVKACNTLRRNILRRLRPLQNSSRKIKRGTQKFTMLNGNKIIRINRLHQIDRHRSEVKVRNIISDKSVSGTKDHAVKDTGTASKVLSRLNSVEKPNKSKNAQLPPKDIVTRRSSSMDRINQHNERRNRSSGRNSSDRDQRDSSVESTQSNIEGKVSRNKRNVLSRYATPAQLPKSPAKLDTVKTGSTKGDDNFSDSKDIMNIDSSEKKPVPSNIVNVIKENTLKVSSIEDDRKKHSESTPLSHEKSTFLLPEFPEAEVKTVLSVVSSSSIDKLEGAEPSNIKDTLISRGKEAIKTTSLFQKSLESHVLNSFPQKLKHSDKQPEVDNSTDKHTMISRSKDTNSIPTSSLPEKSLESSPILFSTPQKWKNSPVKSHVSHINSISNSSSSEVQHALTNKQPRSVEQSLLFQIMPCGPSLSPQSLIPKVDQSNSNGSLNTSVEHTYTAMPGFRSLEKTSVKTNFNKDPWKLQMGAVAELANLEYQSVWENSEIFREMKKEVGFLKRNEKQADIGNFRKHSANDYQLGGPRTQDEKFSNKRESVLSSTQPMRTKSSLIKLVDNKCDTTLQILPKQKFVSSILERPKRKRKVPSRNRDAEEMLSKILSHREEAVTTKKPKISPEPKTTTPTKQKLKKEYTTKSKLLFTDFDESQEEISTEVVTGRTKSNGDEKEVDGDWKDIMKTDDDDDDDDHDKDETEGSGKIKGRFVSNRMYVLEKCGSKNRRLKCYDQVKVFKMINEESLKCLACGESCTQMCNLRRHVIRHHLKWTRFKCKLCKFDSYDRSECTTHLIRGHRNRSINLRNVNNYIIDLVKQGSHARSIKKNQTIKVKQSQKQEENIYARPKVKKILRLPQRAKAGGVSSLVKNGVKENKDEVHLDVLSQTTSKDQILSAQNLMEGNPVAVVCTSEHSVAMVTTPSSNVKILMETDEQPTSKQQQVQQATSKQPNVQQTSKQLPPQRIAKQTTQLLISKPELLLPMDGKDVSSKIARNKLPFNISTRNSPRVFDTRPYNPEAESKPHLSDSKSITIEDQPQTKQEILGRIGTLKKCHSLQLNTRVDRNVQQKGTKPLGVPRVDNSVQNIASKEIVSSDNARLAKNLEKIILHSTSPVSASNVNSTRGDATSIVNDIKLISGTIAGEVLSPCIFEVKIKSPKHFTDKTFKPVITPTERSISSAPSNIEKTKAMNETHTPDDVVTSDQLGSISLLKVKQAGSQLNLTPVTHSQDQVVKVALPGTIIATSKVIDPANLQRKQTIISASPVALGKNAQLGHVKLIPQKVSAACKDTPGALSPPAAIALAAALNKSGNISSSSATPLIVNPGQPGKYIIYSHSPGIKEQKSGGSISTPLSVSSTLPSSSSSSSTSSTVNSSDVNSGSEAKETTKEEAYLPATFVIHKHYL